MKAPQYSHTILWADDDPDDLLLVKEILQEFNDDHKLVELSNGKEVLNYLHTIESVSDLPCLVVLDVNMPVIDGKTALEKIKANERYKNLSVAMFTTSYSEKDLVYFQSLGARVFKKPPSYDGLRRMVKEVTNYC